MKHIALLLAALLVFSLTGCSGSGAASEAPDTDKAGAYEVIPPEDGRGDLIPVSYTHLDVYKRQFLSQVKKLAQHSNSIFAICNSTLLLLH